MAIAEISRIDLYSNGLDLKRLRPRDTNGRVYVEVEKESVTDGEPLIAVARKANDCIFTYSACRKLFSIYIKPLVLS